ncbi:MAG: acyltransferase family protein [Polyangiales bacterium]
MRYSPALDGIRAIAVLGVLIFHVFPTALPGGFVGVDVFFVLSGYLITGNLVRDLQANRFSFREFYLRRAQRLLPNAIVLVGATVLLCRVLLPPSASIDAAKHGVWSLLNLSNVYVWKWIGGYWGDDAVSAPLLHTWSLAVEEQFYLLYPWLLAIAWKAGDKATRRLVVGTAIASFLFCVWLTRSHGGAAFYLLPARGWELLLGASLVRFDVASAATATPRGSAIVGVLGLALIAVSFAFVRESMGFPGWIAAVPCLGGFCLIVAARVPTSPVARFLALPGLPAIGRVSYSIYLWHWPFIVIGRLRAGLDGRPEATGAIVGGALSVAVAVLVYFAVERPLRDRGAGRGRRLATIAALFVATFAADGFVARQRRVADPQHRFDPVVFEGNAYSVGVPSDIPTISRVAKFYDVVFPLPSPLRADLWREGGVVHAYGGPTPRVVVLGSSHALMYAHRIDAFCQRRGISVAFLTVESTYVFFEHAEHLGFASFDAVREFDETRRRWLRDWRPDVVVAVDRWDRYAKHELPPFEASFEAFLKEVRQSARDVVVLEQIPSLRIGESVNLREYANWFERSNGRWPTLGPDAMDGDRRAISAIMKEVSARTPHVHYVPLADAFLESATQVRWSRGRDFYYADDDHLSELGVAVVAERIESALATAMPE